MAFLASFSNSHLWHSPTHLGTTAPPAQCLCLCPPCPAPLGAAMAGWLPQSNPPATQCFAASRLCHPQAVVSGDPARLPPHSAAFLTLQGLGHRPRRLWNVSCLSQIVTSSSRWPRYLVHPSSSACVIPELCVRPRRVPVVALVSFYCMLRNSIMKKLEEMRSMYTTPLTCVHVCTCVFTHIYKRIP